MSEIVTHSRRAALGALASVPALALPALSIAEPLDPIFAVIERHKASWDIYRRISWKALDGPKIVPAEWDAFKAADEELMSTPPTTLAGMRAVVQYLVRWDEGSIPEDSGGYMAILLRSPVFARLVQRVHSRPSGQLGGRFVWRAPRLSGVLRQSGLACG